MKKLLKTLLILMILSGLQSCSVQGTYYLNKSFSQLYNDDSMKVVLNAYNKGYIVISDTITCCFSYYPNFEKQNKKIKLVFEENDSLWFAPQGYWIRNHFWLDAPDARPVFFKKARQ